MLYFTRYMFNKVLNLLNKNKIEIVLCCLILSYIFIFSYLSIIRNLSFNSHYYDLGIMQQTVYNTSKGRILEMTNPVNRENINRIAIHFDPILAIFAPVYWIYPKPEVLLIAQTIIIAFGALAVYLIAVRSLKNKLFALIFAFLYLSYYPLQFANLFDFHAVMFLPALLLFAFYFIEIKKYKSAILFIIISLFTKENVGLTLLFLGLYLLFIKKEKILGSLISASSLLVFASLVFYVIPFFRQGEHFALKYFSLNLIDIPIKLLSIESFNYLIGLFSPLSFLVILSPIQLLIAFPEFLINLLSSYGNMRAFYFQYTSMLIPFIFIAAIYGFAKIKSKLVIVIVLGVSIIVNYYNGPFNQLSFSINKNKLKTVDVWQKKLANDQIKVSTTPRLAPFFTNRRYYFNFLFDPGFWDMNLAEADIIKDVAKYEKADYVIIATDEVVKENSFEHKFYLHLKENKKFKLIYKDTDIEVYKK